jgi:hypothetical protein
VLGHEVRVESLVSFANFLEIRLRWENGRAKVERAVPLPATARPTLSHSTAHAYQCTLQCASTINNLIVLHTETRMMMYTHT